MAVKRDKSIPRETVESTRRSYRTKTNKKIMSEAEKRCSGLEIDKGKMSIIDYLSKRSVSGRPYDSKRFTKKLFDTAKDLYKKDLTAHFGCVNAIEFSTDGNLLFSGGDDRRVLMWNVNDAMMYYTGKMGEGAKPFVMKGCHYSNIFCLAVDDENKRVLSGSNDDQVIVHDCATGIPVDIFLHDSPVFSLSLHPNNGNIFASAADNGRILIYDIRESNDDLLCVAKLRTPFHGVMFNPCEPSLIATANSKVGVHIWDLRKPKEILMKCSDEHSMAVRWNQSGTILLALRNLLPIVIYDPLVPKKKLEFDASTYFNACTMKSCSFAGDNDEYILSGSDDFNLYMWKIPDPWPESNWIGSEHLALTGHRSIVNQVRYSSSKQLIATSGVEKIVKLWSPFPMPYSEGDHDKPTSNRHRVLCSSSSCTRSPGFLSHDYSQESVEEDTRMIHFFDSLLRNELDDMTFLPLSQSYYLDANLFTLPNRKKETRTYEKLIRRKKKHLSRILLEKSCETKSECSLIKSTSTTGKTPYVPEEINQPPSASEDDSNVGGCFDPSPTPLANSNADTSIDCVTSSSPLSNANYSPSFSSPSTTSNAASSVNLSSDSHLSSEQLTSDVASSSSRSKTSFKSTFSDTEDSKSNSPKVLKNSLKDSGINMSESSDSDRFDSRAIFKRRRAESSRCYRNSSKRKRKVTTSTESSDSESANGSHSVNKDRNFSNGLCVAAKDEKLIGESNVVCSDSDNESSTNEDPKEINNCANKAI